MSKVEAGRSIIRLSYVLALVAAVAVAALGVLYERQSREVFRQDVRSEALDKLNVLRSQLQGALDAHIQLMQGLVGIIEYEPGIDQTQFDRLGARILDGREGIRFLSASPGFVISMVYPLRGAESFLGRDYLADPAQRRAALTARALGTPVVTGPTDLVGGRRGFFVRAPVFVEGEAHRRTFWGLVSMAIDETALYRAGGLLDPEQPCDIALAPGSDTLRGAGAQAPFFGDPAVLRDDPVAVEVALPFGNWVLSGVPKGGWPEPAGLWVQRLLFALAGLLVVAPILGAARLVASRQARLAEIRVREAELARLSWRLEFALATSNVGFWDVDLETDRLFWDERCKALFGFSGHDGYFSEADWIGAVHPDDRARALSEARAAADGKGKFLSRYRIVRPDGEVRHIRDIAARYTGDDGRPRLVGLVWDETADVARQEEVELRRREAEAATAAKSRFLAAMSHEIRTPMTGVLGLLGLMLDEPLPPAQKERATIALGSAQSLLEILNDILDYSKLEANQIRILHESVDIRALVAEVVELMAPVAVKKGLALTQSVDPDVPALVESDPMRLRQILTNLVSNAAKFTEAGEVAVRVGHARGVLTIEVEDTGIGIPVEQQARIFEQFVQADSSLSRRASGTGLGLAICREIVGLMGGEIGVRSVPGMGSSFRVTVPAPAVAEAAMSEDGAAPPAEAAGPMPLRVLLAEDNPTNQYLVNAYLRAGGHAVTAVSNGLEAVAAAKTQPFDVVLMDVQMPELDGLAAARQIRALPGAAGQVPIIALTANAMPADRDACLDAGMTDYLAKPIDVGALRAALAGVRVAEPGADLPGRAAAGSAAAE